MSELPKLTLKPKHDRRVRSGHPWVFSNEIADDLRGFTPGEAVDVFAATGGRLGRGYVNPQSLIAVRLLTRDKLDIDTVPFWRMRFTEALRVRQRVMRERTSLRLVHAEGDGLPGLVVDRYGDTLAVQLTTAGTETRKEVIAEALREVFGPTGAVLRSEGRARQLEGLEDERAVWFGDVPEVVEIEEHGVIFRVDLLTGQKTGHFYDQADNRARFGALCAGERVLDMYAHSGGWALQALTRGATEALVVDKSEAACELAVDNLERNGVAEQAAVVTAEGRKFLKQLQADQEQFGAVNLDPPAFAKSRKAAGAALRGYEDINALGLSLVAPGGLFGTSTCSYHVEQARFEKALLAAAKTARRRLRLVQASTAAADHPVRLEIPETRYLKHYLFQVELDA
jgi:23S rRNA (cytosine1962-C5)-methyltransferase